MNIEYVPIFYFGKPLQTLPGQQNESFPSSGDIPLCLQLRRCSACRKRLRLKARCLQAKDHIHDVA